MATLTQPAEVIAHCGRSAWFEPVLVIGSAPAAFVNGHRNPLIPGTGPTHAERPEPCGRSYSSMMGR